MYKIIGKEETFKVLTLAEAMNVAKSMNEFVRIVGTDFDHCGQNSIITVIATAHRSRHGHESRYERAISRQEDNELRRRTI